MKVCREEKIHLLDYAKHEEKSEVCSINKHHTFGSKPNCLHIEYRHHNLHDTQEEDSEEHQFHWTQFEAMLEATTEVVLEAIEMLDFLLEAQLAVRDNNFCEEWE